MELHPLLEVAFEAFPNFVITDDRNRVFYINQGYASLLGIKQTQAIGMNVRDVIPGTRLPEILASGKAEIGQLMTLFDHSKNENITVVCNRLPLYEDGKICGTIGMTTFQDLSDLNELISEMENIKSENKRIKEELNALRSTQNPLSKIIGNSPAMMEVKRTIQNFASSNLSVLLTGETGVGKEVFATALHELSNRNMAPFIKINCAAIPKDLIESELFGYEEGAFTGAKKHGKPGKFELADGGTLLLDEIGEMPMQLQSKLLRVLQEQEVERVGATKGRKVNIRIICSTNQNLKEQVQKKLFRADLYYRINTVELHIPPLRERLSDLQALCDFFINKINMTSGLHTLGIHPSVISLFCEYHWPGNVRELEHVMERLCFTNPNSVISLSQCEFFLKRMHSADNAQTKSDINHSTTSSDRSLHYNRDQAEIDVILDALKQANGNKAKAARILDIDRTTLYYKLKKYNIKQTPV